jgi:hypothetical protein
LKLFILKSVTPEDTNYLHRFVAQLENLEYSEENLAAEDLLIKDCPHVGASKRTTLAACLLPLECCVT